MWFASDEGIGDEDNFDLRQTCFSHLYCDYRFDARYKTTTYFIPPDYSVFVKVDEEDAGIGNVAAKRPTYLHSRI